MSVPAPARHPVPRVPVGESTGTAARELASPALLHLSQRRIAARVRCTHPDVAKVRAQFNARLDLPDRTLGADGRARAATRNDSICTISGARLELALREPARTPRYQLIAEQAANLRRLGYPDCLIAECTGVTDKTVAKAIRWFKRRSCGV